MKTTMRWQSAKDLDLKTSPPEICISSHQSESFSMGLVEVKRREQGLKFRRAPLVHWSSRRRR